MEFPSLGKHCFESSCKQLDFLPMKCDACSNIFCRDHIKYDTHSCTESYKKDNQVPVCPLCNEAISVKKGDLPDAVVSRHIDNDCSSDLAKQRRKIYTNKCSFKGCKQKELVPVKCDKCHQNFCFRHRHETDHKCQGFENTGQGISNAGVAALFRRKTSAGSSSGSSTSQKPRKQPQQTTLTSFGRGLDRERRERQQRQAAPPTAAAATLPAGMTEDEALARAIQLSMAEGQSQPRPAQGKKQGLTAQEQEDQLLAQALAASEEEARRDQRRRQHQQQEKSMCEVS
ncbi:AN1-type zinc finger protein 2A-like isoform X1 [Haliotis rufescens]|uniref:AN1-type zinc finger protein 2A-like isoform X1 n=1 Tax=Haliotis rufescens TaxID=6454 RepID=UPI00201F2A08|nr:AN1-type zinc finger protein 2A-like isoform X1 [Haliotis rufescens]